MNNTKILNDKTGRYVLKSGKIGQLLLKSKCKDSGKELDQRTNKCVSPCKAGKVRDPVTKRCRSPKKKSGPKKKSPSPCKAGKVRDPVTKRCRSPKKKSPSPCKAGKVRDPVTKRCGSPKKKSGPKKKSPSPCKAGKVRDPVTKRCKAQIPTQPSAAVKGILEKCSVTNHWKQNRKKVLALGSVGVVYQVCSIGNCDYILKEQDLDDEFLREVDILKRLKGWEHAPKVYGIWKCKGKGYIMEEMLIPYKYKKVDMLRKLQDILAKLYDKGISFPDCHTGNVMMRKDGTVVLIDFGWSEYFPYKTSTSTYGYLSESLMRPVTLDEVKIWETSNLMDDFGTRKQYKDATVLLDQMIKKEV